MNRNDVKKFLQNCPHKDLIMFLINRVNLSEVEVKIVEYKVSKRYTDEEVSELLDKSLECTRRLIRNTFDKISSNWEQVIEYIKNSK